MRKVEISEDVWQQIKKRGEFGETVDDVLRRVFDINPEIQRERTVRWVTPQTRERVATRRLTCRVNGHRLVCGFEDERLREWDLPDPSDKDSLRAMLAEAMTYVKKGGATTGQVNALRKTLTENGYHLTK